MTTKRRQSSSYSDELSRYEFVDYTSVSNFEKFVTTIEETLLSWGLKDGSFGIFSKEQLKRHGAAIQHPSAQEFTRTETLVMAQDAFQLTFHHHPSNPQQKEEFPLSGDEFYQFGQAYHNLHRWSGLDTLLIIRPSMDSIKKKIFNTGGKSSMDVYLAKQVVSACAVAFQNVVCRVPVFVQVGQSRHEMYLGYMLNMDTKDQMSETEVRFHMSLTTPPSSQLSYLDGLKTLFLQKLSVRREDYGQPGDVDNDFWVSAVYTYNLKNWFDENWKIWDEVKPTIKRKISFSDDFESWGDEDDDEGQLKKQEDLPVTNHQLQFGSFNDPLRTLTLSALFPLSQDALFDDAYQTNMDALTAKQWQISRELAPTHQQRAYLSNLLEQVISSWVKDPSNKEYLAPYDDSNDDSTSDSISLMRNLFSPQTSTVTDQQVNFFKSDQVDNVIQALFEPYSNVKQSDQNKTINYLSTKELGLRLKTGSAVPYRSFLWNLLLYSLEQVSLENGKKQNANNFLGFFKIIWMEVLRKIRWHWENLIPIPNLNPFLYDEEDCKTIGIDLRYNILHQKISMVNCCILRKIQNSPQNGNTAKYDVRLKRPTHLFESVNDETQQQSKGSKFQSMLEKFVDGTLSESADMDDSVSFVASDIEDAESENSDVFLDAVEEDSSSSGDDKEESLLAQNNAMAESFVSLPYIPTTNSADELEAEAATIKDPKVAEGESHIHEHLKLLKTGEPMQIPITQDPGFMTEDMINEQADVFESLGTSTTATHQRAKLQSAQLYSDMQAFKAANPFACLEDFVRWHSPRDWITDEQGGHLSTRMSEPSNIWQELWKCSKRIPCYRQKPLFSISVEAEKGLYFLETTSIYELFSMMLPTLGLISYDALSTHPIAKYSKHVANGLSRLGTDLSEFPWDDLRHGKRTFDSMIQTIRRQESIMCYAISLLRKLPGQYDLVDQLLFHDQAIVKEGEERSAVFQLFRNDNGAISKPSYREYILYSDCKDLTTEGRVLPQRQYAIVKDDEIRILDMQTTDALLNVDKDELTKLDKRKMINSSYKVYQGNEFDVFGKDSQIEKEERFSPLYSKQPANKKIQQELKRTRKVDTAISNTIKKRKIVLPKVIFTRNMASADSPIVGIFHTEKCLEPKVNLVYQ
ncbi:hypothetical protein INT48_009754 [Thamnidium elegans]|uniref:Rab3 GTPase-activating protein catalytic subunit n=1 Tax=Thamnidium elegans TaxID=101142 RepID=A0A8H7ST73_9FUNG|nr:hypothetical protein INT48_009754 [Thamnidium elegans]